MTFDLPAWVPHDPGAPPRLPVPEDGGGRVVALLAAPGAEGGGWAGDVAVELARAWTRAGERVVLADAGLTSPTLHEAAGVPNAEGLTDALLWGASLQRVAHRGEGRGFYLVTAGTAVSDGARAMEAPRWGALCDGFREAGVTLVVFVPVSERGHAAVVARATDLVVLAAPGDDVGGLVGEAGPPVRAVVGRGPAAPTAAGREAPGEEAAGAAPAEVGSGDEGATRWSLPDLGDAAGGEAALFEATPPADEAAPGPEEPVAPALPGDVEGGRAGDAALVPSGVAPAPMADAVVAAGPVAHASSPEAAKGDRGAAPPTLEEIVRESEAPRRAPAARRSHTRSLLLLLFLVVVAVVAAAWFGYVEIPGVTPRGGRASAGPSTAVPAPVPALPAEVSAPVAAPPPEATSPVVGFSVALGAYQDGAVAAERARSLGERIPDVLFITVPLEVEGAVVHRVLAGPAADSAGAVAVAGRVTEAAGLAAGDWVIRRTDRAFPLGETAELEAARRRTEVLAELGVPAYVLAVDHSDGSVRFRVYAGAFADAAEASHLSGLLVERGLSATLSDRTGRLPE